MADATPDPTAPAYSHNGRRVAPEAFYALACDPRRSVAVEACAGAGKTWMLVSRIVRALFEGIDPASGKLHLQPQQILAITFTRRAAGEMRQRLQELLREFAQADAATLEAALRLRGVPHPGTVEGAQLQRQQLANLYGAMLASGREVQVRTFHGWFAALLRTAPLALLQQLGLPLSYELLEDDAPAIAMLWRRFHAALVGDCARLQDFEAVVRTHGRYQTDKALQVALQRRTEFALADAAGVVQRSVQHFALMYPALAPWETPAAALATQPAARRWLGWAAALAAEANKTPKKAAQSIIDAFATLDAAGASGVSRLEQLRRALFVAEENRLTQHLQKYPAAQQAAEELGALLAACAQHEAWLYQQRMAALSRVLLDEYAALKREHGWVDMNDVERAAGVLLADPVLSGWVQQRLDVQTRHLLIDEFQDTNPLQWQALRAWLSGYAGADAGAAGGPSVFIVGDPKQSIYRFRRAEPQVFRAAQRFIAEGLGGDLLQCDHTWRNAQAVVATVNAVMAQATLSDGYEGFARHSTASARTGQVCRLPQIGRPADRAPADASDGWRDSLSTPRLDAEETLRTLEARQVARWIAGQLAQGLAPKDVMVLSRKRAGLGPVLAELRALRIAAHIGEQTELIACCEVQDVVALLDVLVSPGHDLSLARALKSPLFGLDDATLVQLALLQRQCDALSWFDVLRRQQSSVPALDRSGATLVRWKQWLDQLPPHDALQAIYHDGDVLARFAAAAPAHQREVVLANLRALLEASLQLAGGRFSTPYALVRALKAGGVRAPAVLNEAAVRLLTVHGAKGLEAEVVLLLDTDGVERNADTMAVLVDWPGEAAHPHKFVFLASESRPPLCALPALQAEQRERAREELNALYVALTRARHTLALSSIAPHRAAGTSWWQRLEPLLALVQVDAAPLPEISVVGPGSFDLLELPPAPVADQPASAALDVRPDDAGAAALERIGLAMHRVLQWGDASAPSVLAAAQEFGLTPRQGAQSGRMARGILHGAGAWCWDSALLRWQGNEVELLLDGVTLRLDRLVQRKDDACWWVLDYKSTHAPLAKDESVAQLLRYRDALRQLHPGATVLAAFLTPDGALHALPEPAA